MALSLAQSSLQCCVEKKDPLWFASILSWTLFAQINQTILTSKTDRAGISTVSFMALLTSPAKHLHLTQDHMVTGITIDGQVPTTVCLSAGNILCHWNYRIYTRFDKDNQG